MTPSWRAARVPPEADHYLVIIIIIITISIIITRIIIITISSSIISCYADCHCYDYCCYDGWGCARHSATFMRSVREASCVYDY